MSDNTTERELIYQVIDFLVGNEQYGDDWKDHIDALYRLLDKEDENNKFNQ